MNKKKLVFVMLIVSMLLVFTVGPALANPPAGGPPPWSNKDGEKEFQNIWTAHEAADGMEWGEWRSGRSTP